jgi:hypothetical protein
MANKFTLKGAEWPKIEILVPSLKPSAPMKVQTKDFASTGDRLDVPWQSVVGTISLCSEQRHLCVQLLCRSLACLHPGRANQQEKLEPRKKVFVN